MHYFGYKIVAGDGSIISSGAGPGSFGNQMLQDLHNYLCAATPAWRLVCGQVSAGNMAAAEAAARDGFWDTTAPCVQLPIVPLPTAYVPQKQKEPAVTKFHAHVVVRVPTYHEATVELEAADAAEAEAEIRAMFADDALALTPVDSAGDDDGVISCIELRPVREPPRTVGKPERLWTAADAAHASAQGWGMFVATHPGDEEVFEIERDDDSGAFESDDEAVAFVARQALAGDKVAAKALLLDGCRTRLDAALPPELCAD